MATPLTVWPELVLSPRQATAEVVPATTSGGRSITAVETIISFDAGYWTIILDQIPVASIAQKRAWKGTSAILGGRFGTIGVPIYDTDCPPWPLDSNGNPVTGNTQVPFADGKFVLFADGVGFSQDLIVAYMYEDAAQNDTQVSIQIVQGDVLQPGQTWSFGYRMYRIIAASQVSAGAAPVYTVTVNLPLREAIPAGTQIEFDDPMCICRLATDTEMQSAPDDYAGRGLGKVTFVEAINV